MEGISTMGDRIHQKRKELNLTMEQLGDMVGVQKSAVNKWEKNRVERMSTETTLRLCEIFSCDPVWLTYGYDGKEKIELSEIEKEIIYRYRTSPHKEAILSLLHIIV